MTEGNGFQKGIELGHKVLVNLSTPKHNPINVTTNLKMEGEPMITMQGTLLFFAAMLIVGWLAWLLQ